MMHRVDHELAVVDVLIVSCVVMCHKILTIKGRTISKYYPSNICL